MQDLSETARHITQAVTVRKLSNMSKIITEIIGVVKRSRLKHSVGSQFNTSHQTIYCYDAACLDMFTLRQWQCTDKVTTGSAWRKLPNSSTYVLLSSQWPTVHISDVSTCRQPDKSQELPSYKWCSSTSMKASLVLNSCLLELSESSILMNYCTSVNCSLLYKKKCSWLFSCGENPRKLIFCDCSSCSFINL